MTVLCVNSTVVYADITAADAAEGGTDYGTETIFEQSGDSLAAVTFSNADYPSGLIYRAALGEETNGMISVGARCTGSITSSAQIAIENLRTGLIDYDFAPAGSSMLNLVSDGGGSGDVYLYNELVAYTITGCITYNCSDGIRLNNSTNDACIITNHTAVDCTDFGILRPRAVDSVVLNTGNSAYLLVGGSSSNYWADDGTGDNAITEGTPTDIFVDYAGGDYRIKATSSPGVAGAGAFIEASSGLTVTALLNSNYMVEYSMKKNVASQSIGAQMVTIADGTDFTGTVTAEVTIDGGTKTAGGGTVTHEGDGYHSYAPTQAETNGDHIAVSFAGTGALSQTIQVYTTFPQSVDNAVGIGNIDTVVDLIKSDTTAILVDTDDLQTNQGNWLTATGFNTVVPPSVAQFNARSIPSTDYFIVTDYTAPDNAGIASILTDTNELQANQGNWLTATGFATTAEIADIPTVAEFNARTLPSASYSQFDYTTNEVNANIAKINGVTITGNGAGSPFDV